MNTTIKFGILVSSLVSTLACGPTVAVDESRSPLPSGCEYIPSITPNGTDLQFPCPAEIASALARCSGGEPYEEARCAAHPTLPTVWCCPIGVWPRDNKGALVAPQEEGAGGVGMGGGGAGGGAGGTGNVLPEGGAAPK